MPSMGGALLQASAGLTILAALFLTSDDQGFRESIILAVVAVSAYGFFKVVRRKSVVRWWKAWVANFVGVLAISPLAVAGGASPEVVGEMLGMITIPGAIAAAALVPISKAIQHRRETNAQPSASSANLEQKKIRRMTASQRPAPARPKWLSKAMDAVEHEGAVEGLTKKRAELVQNRIAQERGITTAITRGFSDMRAGREDAYNVRRATVG